MPHATLSLILMVSLGAADEVRSKAADDIVPQQAATDSVGTEQEADADQLKKKQWLRDQLVSQGGSRQALRQLNARLKHATPEQLNQLVENVLAQRRANEQRRAGQDLERRIARVVRQQMRRQWQPEFAFRRPVGFYPVITWLPSGTQLYASGVVSPDGRYVRVSATPFFSTIGDVQTFNFATGRTRTISRRSSAKPRVWHNGLTTRYGIPPQR